MSSIRPLATISLLAFVGVMLYLKINETEQTLPDGLPQGFGDEAGAFDEPPSFEDPFAAQTPSAASWDPQPDVPSDAQGFPGPPPQTLAPPLAKQDAFSQSNAETLQYDNNDPAASSPTTRFVPGSESPSSAASPIRGVDSPSVASPIRGVDSPSVASPIRGVDSVVDSETPELPALPPLDDSPTFGASGDVDLSSQGVVGQENSLSGPTTNGQRSGDPQSVLPTPPFASQPGDGTFGQGSASSLFSNAWLEVQSALDRGDLSQALLKLSDWYGDPSLTPEQSSQVEDLLSQLAGSVIYDGPPAHRLEAPYRVAADDTLMRIGEKFDVPWQLLAKINGLSNPQQLQPGQELKVVRGPFSAIIDLSERQLTLMLDRRYAGKFPIELAPQTTLEEGQWKVDQKLLTPSGAGVYGSLAGSGEDRSLILSNLTSPNSESAVLRGPGNADPVALQPRGRAIRLDRQGVDDLFDILSVGSRVIIRR